MTVCVFSSKHRTIINWAEVPTIHHLQEAIERRCGINPEDQEFLTWSTKLRIDRDRYKEMYENRFKCPSVTLQLIYNEDESYSLNSSVAEYKIRLKHHNSSEVTVFKNSREFLKITFAPHADTTVKTILYDHPRFQGTISFCHFIYKESQVLAPDYLLGDLCFDNESAIKIDLLYCEKPIPIEPKSVGSYPFENLRSLSVIEVKQWIEHCHRIPVTEQILVIANHILNDNDSLLHYIQKDDDRSVSSGNETDDNVCIKLFCMETNINELNLIYQNLDIPIVENLSFRHYDGEKDNRVENEQKESASSSHGRHSKIPRRIQTASYDVLTDFFKKSASNLKGDSLLLYNQDIGMPRASVLIKSTLKSITIRFLTSQYELRVGGNSGITYIRDIKRYLWEYKQVHVHLQRIFRRGKELDNSLKIPEYVDQDEEALVLDVIVQPAPTVTLNLILKVVDVAAYPRKIRSVEEHQIRMKDTCTILALKQAISELSNLTPNDITFVQRFADDLEIRNAGFDYECIRVNCFEKAHAGHRCTIV